MSKEKQCLVTQDLVSAVEWAEKAPNSVVKDQPNKSLTWHKQAIEQLENKLSRVWGTMAPAAQHGIDFEKSVYKTVNLKETEKGSEHFKKVVKRIKDHSFQEKIKTTEQIGEFDCCLYGKIDAYKYGDIVDLKTTANLKASKYTPEDFQSQLYCYIKAENKFTFVVVEWANYPMIKRVEQFECFFPEMEALRALIHTRVLKTFNTLKDFGYWELYREKYCLY